MAFAMIDQAIDSKPYLIQVMAALMESQGGAFKCLLTRAACLIGRKM